MSFCLADNLKLPYEAVTQTIALLGMRGSGKATTGVVLTEKMMKPGLPVVVFSPVGVWGLRASADVKGLVWFNLFEQVRVRRRETFNSSTPEVGSG
jgi:Helicase HerA, central domain